MSGREPKCWGCAAGFALLPGGTHHIESEAQGGLEGYVTVCTDLDMARLLHQPPRDLSAVHPVRDQDGRRIDG